MAVDEAILEAVGRGESLPTLRLYAWHPPCLSLGYAQAASDVDVEQLSRLDWQLVRRPTGGRAILHTDELTYAVIAPLSEPRVAGSVLESYQRLSLALLCALRLMGIQAQAEAKTVVRDAQNPICFEVPSSYEITVNGKKLIGSAQARRKEGILQHGSLPLSGDLSRITQALNFPDESSRLAAAERLLARAATVESVLGCPLSWQTAAEAFAVAFQRTLNLELRLADLTPAEQARAAEIVRDKHHRQKS